jgi:TolB protein
MTIVKAIAVALALLTPGLALPAMADVTIDLSNPNVEPVPIAIPDFVAETPDAAEMAREIGRVVAADLTGSGIFREIPHDAFISQITSFDAPVQYADWKAINAAGLITGAVSTGGEGRLVVKFRLHDVFAETEQGQGLQLAGSTASWRRLAHKVADAAYSRITGEGPYFDSRVVFVSESGPKADRRKRLAIMDYDGANVQYLTDSSALVLAPRFSPKGDRVLYTSYESGNPQIMMIDVASVSRRTLLPADEGMSVAPSFSPDGGRIAFSVAKGGNSDIYVLDIASGQQTRLTDAPSIETAPSYSPDGRSIVFESDRSGVQQIYVMPAGGGEPARISSGDGKYATPVWSPRGDYVAFTKQSKGTFFIGVMRPDGSDERLLTSSPLDEGPSWSPNGRVIMFTRTIPGDQGGPSLYTVDVSGRNLRKVPTDSYASDPAWSPLLP